MAARPPKPADTVGDHVAAEREDRPSSPDVDSSLSVGTETYDDVGAGPVLDAAVRATMMSAEDRFEVLGEHARGGLGVVLQGRDRLLGGRRVAIKELLRYDERREQRFRREAMITAQLEHPGVVPVYHVGRWKSGVPFYVMKLIEGRSLAELIEDSAVIGERLRLLPHVAAVADTMAYVHSRGVIHRDLKPSNVIVGDFGETVVVDWGLAKRVSVASGPAHSSDDRSDSGALTRDGAVLGTPQYMAPEQASAGDADARSDVYAIGGILFHVLTGQPPRPHSGDGAVAVPIEPTPSVHELEPRVPRELVAIVDRSLDVEPAARYEDCRTLVEDLRRFERGQLIAAYRYSRIELVRRWLKKQRMRLALAVLVGVAAGAGALAWFYAGEREHVSCAGDADEFDGIWRASERSAIRAAFAASGHRDVDRAYTRFAGIIDDYVATWSAAATRACRDTHHLGRQSAATLDLRTACLARRKSALAALVRVYAGELDARTADRAAGAAARLPEIGLCDDTSALGQRAEMPPGAVGRERVAEANAMLDRATAQELAGRYRTALSLARDAHAQAEAIDYPLLRAQVKQRYASLLRRTGKPAEAETLLRDAITLASRARDDLLVASVWIDYLWTLSLDLQRPREAIALEHAAWSASVRAAGEGKQRGSILQPIAISYDQIGDSKQALERMTRAAALFEADPSTRPDTVASVLGNTGYMTMATGELDLAADYLERALVLDRAHFGAGHPELAYSLHVLGRVEVRRGRLDRGGALLEEALAIRSERLGKDHSLTLTTELGIAVLQAARGERADALATFERVYETQRNTLPDSHAELNETRTEYARVLADDGQLDRASALATAAVRALSKDPVGRIGLAEAELVLAGVHQARGDTARAAASARAAHDIFERYGNRVRMEQARVIFAAER